MSTIRITCEDSMHPKVTIDGEPVKYVTSFGLDHQAGDSPRFYLSQLGGPDGAQSMTREFQPRKFTLEIEVDE